MEKPALEPIVADALDRWGSSPDRVEPILERMADPAVRQDAIDANLHRPRLRDEHTVEFHPSWDRLITQAKAFGLHGVPWVSTEKAPHLTRAAGFYLWSQVEAGHGCPISMTYAAIPSLQASPALAAEWTPRLAGDALAGMTMTEKQGGSDLRAIETTATRQPDGTYLLDGAKWFCSAPMCDVFLVLARTDAGPTCFLVPRTSLFAVRLKNKLGNHSNASAEVIFRAAPGWRVGDEGRGLPTILAAVSSTRLDCVLGSAALMRRAVTEAVAHAKERHAFGGPLFEKPVMRNVLADLLVEQQASTLLGMRLAAAVDAGEHGLLRIALPAAKYLVCKRTPGFVAEALECFGGNGFVEDASPMALLFRESPLNSIWEGSGSIQALDVLRALQREPEALDAWLTEVGAASGRDPHLDRAITDVLESLSDLTDLEARARVLAERFAAVLQAALLVRHGPPEVAAAFCASRLPGFTGLTYGTLPRGADVTSILETTVR